MTTSFPALRPVSRTYTPGEYPVKRFNAINGASATRLYGSKAFDAQMSLEFIVDDAELISLTTSWNESNGGFDHLELPIQVFSGMDSSVFPEQLIWRWAEVPSVSSVRGELSRVSVKLIATLEVT